MKCSTNYKGVGPLTPDLLDNLQGVGTLTLEVLGKLQGCGDSCSALALAAFAAALAAALAALAAAPAFFVVGELGTLPLEVLEEL